MQQEVLRLWSVLQERAWTAPDADAVPLVLDGRPCGETNLLVATSVAGSVPGFYLKGGALRLEDTRMSVEARSDCLELAARWMLQVGFVASWREELLDVRAGGDGEVLARVDRCAVRALGITTRSVRLNGFTNDGRLYVARRAEHKRVDPGLWDNLSGGLVASGESLTSALTRESLEEAGLDLNGRALQSGARLQVRRHLSDGVLCEVVHVFDIDLEADTHVDNRDGEVDCFEIWDLPKVLLAIERSEFTIEASLTILDSLMHRRQL